MNDLINNNQEMDSRVFGEYLQFLLGELSRYKQDWNISMDDINSFKNELSRFKGLAISEILF